MCWKCGVGKTRGVTLVIDRVCLVSVPLPKGAIGSALVRIVKLKKKKTANFCFEIQGNHIKLRELAKFDVKFNVKCNKS